MYPNPVPPYLIIERDAPETHRGGIELPPDAIRPKQTGTVTALPQPTPLAPAHPNYSRVKVGTRVFIPEYAGQEVEVSPGKYATIINIEDVIATFPGTPDAPSL